MNARHRQEAIVRALRRNGFATIDGLGASFGASRRTILRDIAALRDQGFAIRSEPGRGGGIRLDAQAARPTPNLSVIEVFALVIGVATMRAATALPFSDLADTGLAKIEKALPADRVGDLRQLLSRLYIGRISPKQDLSAVGPIDPGLLPAFETAFFELRKLRFDYCDAKGQASAREVEPQAVLILPPLWYLVAWDPARDDFRHFRMDRIRRPTVVPTAAFRRRHVPFDDDVCPYGDPIPGERRPG